MKSEREQDAERMGRFMRGLEQRVRNLEEQGQENAVAQPFRSVTERCVTRDAVTVTVDPNPVLVLDEDKLDYSELNNTKSTLSVTSGETHTVSSGEREAYNWADITGTLSIKGTLKLTG